MTIRKKVTTSMPNKIQPDQAPQVTVWRLIKTRVTEEEALIIRQRAKGKGLSIAAYARQKILDQDGRNIERWMRLGRLGGELLELKRVIYESGKIPREFIEKLELAIEEIRDLREQLR